MIQDIPVFLTQLSAHNNPDWFAQNRSQYTALRKEFQETVEKVLLHIMEIDPGLGFIQPKHCMFRINRDIRFSHDKTPYKTWMSAQFAGDKKKGTQPGYYFHIDTRGNIEMFAGWNKIDSSQLYTVRQNIHKNSDYFLDIIQEPSLNQAFGELSGESLKTYPRGFEQDDPMIEWLRLTNYMFVYRSNIRAIVNYDQLAEEFLSKSATAVPFISFLRTASVEIML
jgi:uncharacterized protein (TIGR02453 family)